MPTTENPADLVLVSPDGRENLRLRRVPGEQGGELLEEAG